MPFNAEKATTYDQLMMMAQASKDYTDRQIDKMTFVFDQPTASARWVIQHNMGHFPNVSVVDSGGNEVVGEVNYQNENALTVTFSGAFSGKAYLS